MNSTTNNLDYICHQQSPELPQFTMRNWNTCLARSKSKRFNIHLTICKLEGLTETNGLDKGCNMVRVHIAWGVSKKYFLFRRMAERKQTSRKRVNPDGSVHWNEGFTHTCKLRTKDYTTFRSRKINLNIHQSHEESSTKSFSVLAQLSLDIAEYANPIHGVKKVVELPFKYSTFEAKLSVEISVFMLQDRHLNRVRPSSSPIHYLLSMGLCAKSQEETIITTNRSINSGSDEEPDPDPSYKRIFTTNMLVNNPPDETMIYHKEENWEQDQPTQKPSIPRILSWNNNSHVDLSKDEPLLKKVCKDYEDDISLDYTPLSSDRFEIGTWERRRLISRDRKYELVTDIFLASIDQCSEQASGEAACAVLAVYIADWLHHNPGLLPLRSQLDKLIREGSLEWRNLCKQEIHMEKFSNQHFDLDTIIGEKLRSIELVPARSHIGFFELGNTPAQVEFLQGVNSFDKIWDELQSRDYVQADIYIGSWNDHFFVLKIEEEAIYMIDTLGERLTEGCDKAYMLKFDKDSKVYRVKEEVDSSSIELISEGKSSCKDFIKEFLTAVPLRDLQGNIARGIIQDTHIHNLQQIEFHYTTICTSRYTATPCTI